MLKQQVMEWNKYLFTDGFNIIVVDDGSPEAAESIIREHASETLLQHLQLYRIHEDIPWNRGGARNLGAKMAKTNWIMQIDIDHMLDRRIQCDLAKYVAALPADAWFRFSRFRYGRADETRKKDRIPDAQEHGQIHPHGDSYLCTRDAYWKVGGYDEDYSGCLGGGSPFLLQMKQLLGEAEILPPRYSLTVFTRDKVKDASDTTLDRSKDEYAKRRRTKERSKDTRAKNPIRFTWTQVL